MTPLYTQTEQMLKDNPAFRERKIRLYYIAEFLIDRYHLPTSPTILADALSDSESVNRYVRLIQASNETLRGKDYDTKRLTEERKELELGYEPRYHQDIKQGKLL